MESKTNKKPPKLAIQVPLLYDAVEHVYKLMKLPYCNFRSMSQALEVLMQWIRKKYNENELILEKMAQIKADYLAHRFFRSSSLNNRRIHICMEQDVVDYLDMICKTYTPICSSRGEFISLSLLYAKQLLENENKIDYLGRRLHEIMVYEKRSKPQLSA